MKLKWLWIILLVLMITVVCGLIVSVLGIGIYSFTGISSVSNSAESVIDNLFTGDAFSNPTLSIETTEEKTLTLLNTNLESFPQVVRRLHWLWRIDLVMS